MIDGLIKINLIRREKSRISV